MKLTLMKFFVGGFAELLSYIVSVTLPWKEFGGICNVSGSIFSVYVDQQVCNMVIKLLRM